MFTPVIAAPLRFRYHADFFAPPIFATRLSLPRRFFAADGEMVGRAMRYYAGTE